VEIIVSFYRMIPCKSVVVLTCSHNGRNTVRFHHELHGREWWKVTQRLDSDCSYFPLLLLLLLLLLLFTLLRYLLFSINVQRGIP